MRLPGWETKLIESIEAARHTPFEWGQFDCVLWSAGMVLALTGQDLAKPFRGRYTTRTGAYRIINKLGGLPAHIGTLLPPIPVTLAKRGDVVFFEHSVGVCAGLDSFFVTESGLAAVRTLQCEAAWRVE